MRDIGYHKGDEWYTTPELAEEVFNLIEPVIKGRKIYCFCDDENSEIVKILLKNGYDVKYSNDDIFADNSTFKQELEKKERFFFTNPPFSKGTLIQKMMLEKKVDFIVFSSVLVSPFQCDLAFNKQSYFYNLGTRKYHFGGVVGTYLISSLRLSIKIDTEKYIKRDNEILTIDGIDYVYNSSKYFINTEKVYDNIALSIRSVLYADKLLEKYDYVKFIRPVIDGKALFARILMTKKKTS